MIKPYDKLKTIVESEYKDIVASTNKRGER